MKITDSVIVSVCCVAFVIQVACTADMESNPYVEALRTRPWKSIQNYVEVRTGVHLFYWLYYADGTPTGADRKPLFIWIQGGPGLAASGLANFAEIGPLDMNFQPRNHTWVHGRNLLMIDHPVGTGFSYAANNNKSLLVKTDREIAIDLSRVIKVFFKRHKQFRITPAYIFGQSYGGKICPRLATYLHTAIQKKRLKMNLKGIAIGSGWVNPKESTLVQSGYLYNMGAIDQRTYLKTVNMSKEMCNHMDKKEYLKATKIHNNMIQVFIAESGMQINFNNINEPSPYPNLAKLAVKVNKYVKPMLSHVVNQSMNWDFFSDEVWMSLNQSFLVPSHKFLEIILNTTNIKVAVYNGNLDVVTPLAGAANWVHKLRWPGAQDFKNAPRVQINGNRNGFYKAARQLSFWGVFGSGHWVPEENPVAMQHILEYMVQDS